MVEPSLEDAAAASLVARSTDVHGEGNFLQGCQFSPDGLCVLTNTVADSKLRLYDTPLVEQGSKDVGDLETDSAPSTEWKTILSMDGGESIRSYTWYPSMSSADPASCCFLATARDQPVHLYDAYSGSVRATYCPFNALDELEAPNVVRFSGDGQQILAAGFRTDRTMHIFDTARPGRSSTTVLRLGKTRRSSDGQKGLVSAIAFGGQATKQVVAVGTYAPGSIYIYDLRGGRQPTGTILNGVVCVVGRGKGHSRKKRRFVDTGVEVDDDNHGNSGKVTTEGGENWFSDAKAKWFRSKAQGGVTQVEFASAEEYILYSASRRSNCVISWDLRMLSDDPDHQSNPIRGLASYATNNDTNQRIEFDVESNGSTMYVGSQDNCVRIYDISSGKLTGIVDGLDGVANGVSHAYQRNGDDSYLAVATGSRNFPSEEDIENERFSSPPDSTPGNLHLYKMKKLVVQAD